MLYYLALNDYTGEGCIADLGAYLGGSTMCFAAALGQKAFDRPLIHSYDLFRVDFSRQCAERSHFPEKLTKDARTREVFDNNLRKYLSLVTVHEGDILEFSADEPVEYLFVDIAKSYRVMDHLLLTFFPALIAARSLIIVQDYLWGSTGPWHHVVMEKLSDYCEYVADTNINSAVFHLREAIPAKVLEECQWMAIPFDEKVALMDRAIGKLDTAEKKQFLRENRELLLQGKDTSWGMHYHGL